MSDRKQIVFISLERWDDIWRRNQFVCAELERRGWQILFLGPARDVSNALRTLRLAALKPVASRSPEGMPAIKVATWSKFLPNSFGASRRVNEYLRARFLLRQMRKLKMARPILWINDQELDYLADVVPHGKLIYDVTDDWISMEQPEHLRERTRCKDAHLCGRADATIVCSERLRELKQPLAPDGRVHLVANGVNAEHYTRSPPPQVPAGATWERPCFGYTGTIHPGRIDVGLLEAVARRLTSGTIAMIGPDSLAPSDRARLLATGRIRFTGAVPYAELPDWMTAVDVFIVPHKRDAFVESLNPIKLWEYLACGKPVVATSVPGFRERPEVIRLADDADAFAYEMHEALAEGDERSECRRSIALANSWSSRVDRIEAILLSGAA